MSNKVYQVVDYHSDGAEIYAIFSTEDDAACYINRRRSVSDNMSFLPSGVEITEIEVDPPDEPIGWVIFHYQPETKDVRNKILREKKFSLAAYQFLPEVPRWITDNNKWDTLLYVDKAGYVYGGFGASTIYVKAYSIDGAIEIAKDLVIPIIDNRVADHKVKIKTKTKKVV